MKRRKSECMHLVNQLSQFMRGIPQDCSNSIVYAIQCNCGEWMSMGPARITPEVEIEIRAAEIAAFITLRGLGDGAEIAGWIEHCYDSEKVPEQPGEWAGWLARQIATHEGPP